MQLLLAPLTVFGQAIPNPLSVEWQGRKPCERVYEDAKILIARCTFPPGSKHVMLSQPGYLSYVLSSGKSRLEDAEGTRELEAGMGSYTNNPPLLWRELTNVGDTTLSYLVIERKYEPVAKVEQSFGR